MSRPRTAPAGPSPFRVESVGPLPPAKFAGRHLGHEDEGNARRGYARLFAEQGISVDTDDPARLVLFPEMDARADVAEITTACWAAPRTLSPS